MKYSFLMLLYVFIVSACSTENHIISGINNGLKTLQLVQSADKSQLNGQEDLWVNSDSKMKFNYLYEEKKQDRPEVTLHVIIDKDSGHLLDSLLFINLDGEDVSLSLRDAAFVIPENLWVPIVHSQNIQYRLNPSNKTEVIKLNARQRDKVVEFFYKAIKLRDDIFPAIPEGQKKW